MSMLDTHQLIVRPILSCISSYKSALWQWELWPQPPRPQASIVKTRQTDRWHHLLAISCNKETYGMEGCNTILEGCGAVHMPCWMQNSTNRWPCGCVSSFNSRRRLWQYKILKSLRSLSDYYTSKFWCHRKELQMMIVGNLKVGMA